MGKHVVISREGGDFSMDLIFAGLVRRFGHENVIDYPSRAKFRQGKPKLTGDPEADYGAERRSLCYVDDCENRPWYTVDDVQDYVDSHRCADAGREQATIWMDETDFSLAMWHRIAGWSSKKPRTVVVAGHDSFRGDPFSYYDKFYPQSFGEHGPKTGQLTLFIDDWQYEYDKIENAHLINLSCNFDHLWDVENREKYLADKIYDICFIGYNSNPIRKHVIDYIRDKWAHLNNCLIFETVPNQYDNFVRHDEMFRLMAQSKICLNLPGASTTGRALRYYEIPYVGSLMLSLKSPTVYLEPIMGEHFYSLYEMDQLIDRYLSDPMWRRSEASLDHMACMKYHTVDARMDYIFEVLDGQK